jgi:dihydroorotase
LTDADVDIGDARFKMNPPLREAADRRALREAVADGTLQALATDHAPHGVEAKSKGFRDAPFGVVGLETAVGVTYTELVVSGLMNVASWLERWTVGPWKVLGRKPPGLAPGETADLVILDLSSRWTVRPEEFLSKSRNTPFEGRCLKGRPVYTFCRGRLSWGSERA